MHLKTVKGNICLLGLVNGKALSLLVAAVEKAVFSEKRKWNFHCYQTTLLFTAVRHCVFHHCHPACCSVAC